MLIAFDEQVYLYTYSTLTYVHRALNTYSYIFLYLSSNSLIILTNSYRLDLSQSDTSPIIKCDKFEFYLVN